MTKEAFFDALLARLAGLPREERQRVVSYYEELLLDGLESGRDEQELIAGFGQVDDIARKIWEEYATSSPQKRGTGKKVLEGVAWFFFGLIVGLPLLLSAAALYLCGWAVLLSLAAAAVALGISGVYACVAAAFFLVSAPLNALFQIGAGLLMLGIFVLFTVGVWALFRLYIRFSRWLVACAKRKFVRRGATAHAL